MNLSSIQVPADWAKGGVSEYSVTAFLLSASNRTTTDGERHALAKICDELEHDELAIVARGIVLRR